MTPAQTAVDIMQTIPALVPCCAGEQSVSVSTLSALREAVQNAADEEQVVHRILLRMKPVAQAHVVRMQAEADGAVALSGKPHPVSEEWLAQAKELLQSINARLGPNED